MNYYVLSPEVIEVGMGYRVEAWLPGGNHGICEQVAHFALFASKSDAQKLCDAIKASGGTFNKAHWRWNTAPNSVYKFIRTAPTAILETRPRPPRSGSWPWQRPFGSGVDFGVSSNRPLAHRGTSLDMRKANLGRYVGD